MNKKFISMMIAMLLTVTMIVPAMAGNGDNTGDDTFGWSLNITNASLYGDYTLGTVKTFKAELWTGTNKITNVTREMKVTGVAEVTGLEYKDDAAQWHPISEFNVAVPELLRDINREFRVTFNETGKYTFEFNIYDNEGKVILSSKKEVNVTETGIERYVEPETTTEETTVEVITTPVTTEETTTQEPTSEETTAEPTSVPETTTIEESLPETTTEIITDKTTTEIITDETTTKEVISETTTEIVTDETTTVETTPVTTAEKSTTVPSTNKTTSVVATSQKPTAAITLSKVKIKKAAKRKALGLAKISVKKIKKAQKYQVQISKSKKFTNKNILVKKTVKKVKFTIKSKKIKSKKKLYVRARAYAVVGGNKYYGKWSKKKKIRIR